MPILPVCVNIVTYSQSALGQSLNRKAGLRLQARAQNHKSPVFAQWFQPLSRSIISADKISEPGLTLSCPAYRGAVPCVASNIATDSDRFAPGAIPIPPT